MIFFILIIPLSGNTILYESYFTLKRFILHEFYPKTHGLFFIFSFCPFIKDKYPKEKADILFNKKHRLKNV